MPEINKHEIRSPEMQEVMSEIPGSILRWGLLLFFAIVMSIIGVSWFINYPDKVTAPVTVTTYNSPASLVARTGGKIERLFVANNDRVSENQAVAVIENQADMDDIVSITSYLAAFNDTTRWDTEIKNIKYPSGLSLGEVQSAWLRLIKLIRKYKEYIHQAYIPRKLELLNVQIKRQEEYIYELGEQINLSEEDLRLSINSYRRDSLLFYQNSNSISISGFERSKQALIQKKMAFSSLKSSLKNTESSLINLKESLLDLNVQYDNENTQYYTDINESFQLLKVSMGQWEEKYLIRSPVYGTVTFTSFWNENQVINPGETLATIIPEDPSGIIIRAKVPLSGSGRIRTGQAVNIKLTGYPYMEFGVLRGIIRSFSLVPDDGAYIAEIEPVSGLVSSYGKELGFINDMTGTADIITDNKRLIYRFIEPLKSIIKR